MRLLYRNRVTVTANIASGQTTSNAINIGDFARGGYRTPAALTGTTFTIQVSHDGSTFNNLAASPANTDATAQTVGVNKSYHLPADVFQYNFFKIVSGTAEAAARAITVSLKA